MCVRRHQPTLLPCLQLLEDRSNQVFEECVEAIGCCDRLDVERKTDERAHFREQGEIVWDWNELKFSENHWYPTLAKT